MPDLAASFPDAELLDAKAVARLLSCSSRTVQRLRDAGTLPPPVNLGALVRWRRASILEWIESGCPTVRAQRGVGR